MSSSVCLLWTRGGNYLGWRNLLLSSPFAGVYFSHVEILLSQLTVSWRAVDLWKECWFRLWLKVLWGDMNSSSQIRGDGAAAACGDLYSTTLHWPLLLVRLPQVCVGSSSTGYKKWLFTRDMLIEQEGLDIILWMLEIHVSVLATAFRLEALK